MTEPLHRPHSSGRRRANSHRRRPRGRAHRPRLTARSAAGLQRGGRGPLRGGGRARGTTLAARRRRDGHPHAERLRHRRLPNDHQRAALDTGGDAHQLRRLGGALLRDRRGRVGIRPQASRIHRAGRRGADGRLRRVASRPVGHEARPGASSAARAAWRKPGRSPTSPNRSAASSPTLPTAHRTAISPTAWASRRRPSATTSRTCSPSCRWRAEPRPPPTRSATGSPSSTTATHDLPAPRRGSRRGDDAHAGRVRGRRDSVAQRAADDDPDPDRRRVANRRAVGIGLPHRLPGAASEPRPARRQRPPGGGCRRPTGDRIRRRDLDDHRHERGRGTHRRARPAVAGRAR